MIQDGITTIMRFRCMPNAIPNFNLYIKRLIIEEL
jgi:hypothetical protein